MRVGIGMVSRGEVGLIVAGVGVSSGALSNDIYTAVIIMVAATTIITPIWLKLHTGMNPWSLLLLLSQKLTLFINLS